MAAADADTCKTNVRSKIDEEAIKVESLPTMESTEVEQLILFSLLRSMIASTDRQQMVDDQTTPRKRPALIHSADVVAMAAMGPSRHEEGNRATSTED
jgi:hypothetical protein